MELERQMTYPHSEYDNLWDVVSIFAMFRGDSYNLNDNIERALADEGNIRDLMNALWRMTGNQLRVSNPILEGIGDLLESDDD